MVSMQHKIPYQNMVCTVYTEKNTFIQTPALTTDPPVVEYTAWRWLYHNTDLSGPLNRLCLQFRLGQQKKKSLNLVVTVPVTATGLTGQGNLHLLLRLSQWGVKLQKITQSNGRLPASIFHHIHQIVFHH